MCGALLSDLAQACHMSVEMKSFNLKNMVLRFFPFCLLLLIFSSCAFKKLGKEVAILDQTSVLQGTISSSSPHQKPLIVLLYHLIGDTKRLVAYSIHHKPGTFTFHRMPGQYLITAFEDKNEDLIYQTTEYAGYAKKAHVITVKSGEDIFNLDLTVNPSSNIILAELPDLTSPDTKSYLDLPKVQSGEIVTLADRRFSKKNGQRGLWQPIKFLRTIGGGTYFLEPFNSDKIPVVFVHGVGGNPGQFRSLIDNLDRTRYQPWVFYYPSGLRLNMNADLLVRSLSEIYVTHKFEKIVIMAHSMGGLVSRSLVNTIVEKDVEQKARVLFLTLSTPWGGHQAAQIGVDHAPAVIPSWIDMIPHSPFQRELFKTPLSDHVSYYLLFSFKGGRNPFTNGNDDGTVSLVSQLKAEAQDAAIKVIGFNEGHDSILRSPEVSQKMQSILTEFANRE